MTYEKKTDKIDLEELEVQAEEVSEVSGSWLSIPMEKVCGTFSFL